MLIDHLSLIERRIYLAVGVREFHPIDVYKEIRTLRRTDESMRGFDTPVMAYGNVPKGGGKFTPRYSMFRLGWKIVPEDVSHILYVNGEMITDAGEPGTACFDLEPLSAESKIIIQYEPPAAEVIVSEEIPEGVALEASVQAVKNKTDNLPTDPASQAQVANEIGLSESNLIELLDEIIDHCENRLEATRDPNDGEAYLTLYNDAGNTLIKKWKMRTSKDAIPTDDEMRGMNMRSARVI